MSGQLSAISAQKLTVNNCITCERMVCKIYVIDLSEENQYAPRKENPSEARDADGFLLLPCL